MSIQCQAGYDENYKIYKGLKDIENVNFHPFKQKFKNRP